VDVPLYVKGEFGKFYKAAFDQVVREQDMRAVFTEYAWDMSWCDPCAGQPLTSRELVELGARWIGSDANVPYTFGNGGNLFVTRLHVRYDAAHFPEDLALMETRDRENFQARYVLHHPWRGTASCSRAAEYRSGLQARFKDEARNLADLTGWPMREITQRMAAGGQPILSKCGAQGAAHHAPADVDATRRRRERACRGDAATGASRRTLDSSYQRQDDDDDEDQPESAARPITPVRTVGPRRKRADEQQNENDDQDGREHRSLR